MIGDQTLFFSIWDADNLSYFIDANGGVDKRAQFTPLKNKPIGWNDLQPSFDTIDKYYSLKAALSVPLQYVLDGAQILRYKQYKGEAFNEELYLVVHKYNPESGNLELEYKGRLDMAKVVDDPKIGITVSAKEGGMQACIDQQEGTNMEFPLNGTNPDCIRVYFDGNTLQDKLNYTVLEIDIAPNEANATYTPLPMIFANNEGDSVGIVRGDQTYDPTLNFTPYNTTSGNYLLYSIKPLTVTLAGELRFKWRSDTASSGRITIFYYTSKQSGGVQSFQTFYDQQDLTTDTFTVNFARQIQLAADEKLFIFIGIAAPAQNHVTVTPIEGTISFSYESNITPRYIYCVKPLPLLKWLAGKISDQKYTATSDWFTANSNFVLTSGQALRGLPDAKLTISLEKFFDDYNKTYCLCANVANNVLRIEHRSDFYSVAGGSTYDIGEISDIKISLADENIIGKIQAGWPSQEYGERNGRFEFNTTNEYKAPAKIQAATQSLIPEARADSYGMTFIVGDTKDKESTDNKGDTERFMIDVDERVINFSDDFIFSTFPFIQIPNFANNLYSIDAGDTIRIVSALNSGTYTVISVANTGVSGLQIFVNEPLQQEIAVATVFFSSYILFRDNYDIDPPVNLPVPTFNMRLRPVEQLLRWKSWYASIFKQSPNGYIDYQSTKKNADVVTVKNGVELADKAKIRISSLGDGFFLNYRMSFKTAPRSFFHRIFRNLQAATEITATYNRLPVSFIPVGKMSGKTFTNEAQEWELMLSNRNNLDQIYTIAENGIYITDIMDNTLQGSVFNPIQWVYYDKQLPEGIKYKDIFDGWVHERNDQFAEQPFYAQKWEHSDYILNQFIATGMGALELHIHRVHFYGNCIDHYEEVAVITSTVMNNPTVQQPSTLHQWSIDPGGYEGDYVFTITANGVILLISEFQNIAPKQPDTYKTTYYNSVNRLDVRFNNGADVEFLPMIRYEAAWGKPTSDGSANDYEDEPRNVKVLYSDTWYYKGLYIGFEGPGTPDWLHIKLNAILWLDRVSIEGTYVVRPADSKFQENTRVGFPFSSFVVDMRKASGNLGIIVKDDGTIPVQRAAAYSLDLEAYGRAGNVISVDIDL